MDHVREMSNRTRQSKHTSSRCLNFGDNAETDSPSNSDGFEEVIYSQGSPKRGEAFRDFHWEKKDRFVYYRSPLQKFIGI
jgi:hypothetical protein